MNSDSCVGDQTFLRRNHIDINNFAVSNELVVRAVDPYFRTSKFKTTKWLQKLIEQNKKKQKAS